MHLLFKFLYNVTCLSNTLKYIIFQIHHTNQKYPIPNISDNDKGNSYTDYFYLYNFHIRKREQSILTQHIRIYRHFIQTESISEHRVSNERAIKQWPT